MGIETAALLTYAAVASTVVAAGSAIYTGVQASNAADTNAELARRQGVQDADAAVAQAEKIRKAARAQAGAANAALAVSGVSVGDGTPIRINEQIYQDSEQDAYNTLLTGSRAQRTANNQANVITAQGNSAMISGALNAGSSLLAGGANYAKWKATK